MSWTVISKGWSKCSTKKDHPRECQESGFVLKVILSDSKQISRGNECLITKDSDKLVCPVNTDAVMKYFVNMKSSISRKPEKVA